MRRNLLFAVVFSLLCLNISMAQPNIPVSMEYCGIELTFTPGARVKLAEYVKKIHESPRYFNEMVRRADMYMPFIEEAFANVRVPQDLKYLAIQESALRPDVVSKSNAVGFWQFKEAAALQYGLRVNEDVDERSHIYRASEAAAMYLAKSNQDFDNWVYAVIAYYEGLTGAVSYTNPEYYSATKMSVNEDLHWYVLKAIAHKIAYEEALKLPRSPEIYLYPISSAGESNYRKLVEENGVEEELFLQYNKWIRPGKKLPKGETFTCYIPKSGEFYTGHITDPNKVQGGGTPVYLASAAKPEADMNSLEALLDKQYEDKIIQPKAENSETIPSGNSQPLKQNPERPIPPDLRYAALHALPASELRANMYVDFPLKSDLHYNIQYVQFDGTLTVEEIANHFVIPVSDILVWNGLIPGAEPRIGSMIYLAKPSKNEYHIVRKGESLPDIAARHFTSIGKVRKLNRMDKGDLRVYVGQKLYLKKMKPKGERIMILSEESPEEAPLFAENSRPVKPTEKPGFVQMPASQPAPAIVDMGKTSSRDVKPAQETPAKVQPQPAVKEETQEAVQKVPMKWTYHTVKSGETLWVISQKYGTKVEIIKMVNKLTSDTLPEGKVLRIFAKAELVKE
ncbi:MAG: LysM peptidoglycan-binding domain-containing protein [Bacteroidia bacterium]